jgi:tetraacyldisaccharide 4'-kinase
VNVDGLWYDRTVGARILRATVSPFSWLYGSIVATRNAMYDRGILRVHGAAVPVVSVGNLTVGGTGKTPFTAYIVRELLASGHHPAVVMRGYGDDEVHLHARMNPGIPVITDADRVAGMSAAVVRGADVIVLDDGFQHRRAARDLDIVLVSTEKWRKRLGLLPAGPLREPLRSLNRADLIVVTRKSASEEEAQAVVRALGELAAVDCEIVVAELAPDAIVAVNGGGLGSEGGSDSGRERIALESIRGQRVLAIAGVGDPDSFFAQLRQLGAIVTERRFPDHHAYTAADSSRLVSDSSGHKYVIATEKDTVKLAAVWPAKSVELWYLSQAVRLSERTSLVAAALAKLFRRATSIA